MLIKDSNYVQLLSFLIKIADFIVFMGKYRADFKGGKKRAVENK